MLNSLQRWSGKCIQGDDVRCQYLIMKYNKPGFGHILHHVETLHNGYFKRKEDLGYQYQRFLPLWKYISFELSQAQELRRGLPMSLL